MIFLRILAHAVATVGMLVFIVGVSYSFYMIGGLVKGVIDHYRGKSVSASSPNLWWWIQLSPGILVQVWYASYLAFLIQSLPGSTSSGRRAAIEITCVLGMAGALALFDLIHRKAAKIYRSWKPTFVAGGMILAAFLIMLARPPLATAGSYWEKILVAVIGSMLEG